MNQFRKRNFIRQSLSNSRKCRPNLHRTFGNGRAKMISFAIESGCYQRCAALVVRHETNNVIDVQNQRHAIKLIERDKQY